MILGAYSPNDAAVMIWRGEERCGFMLTKDDEQIVVEVTNQAKEPHHSYDIDPMDSLAVQQRWPEHSITGLWHHHPPGANNAGLSETDAEWHPAFLDLYIVHELRWRRWQFCVNEYQEKGLPWTA
jgi:proteasome lid subunit RPN8/RPN11